MEMEDGDLPLIALLMVVTKVRLECFLQLE